MSETKRFSLVKPTVDTPFQIDFEWWKNHDQNWRVYLHSFLCEEHKTLFSEADTTILIDYIDPDTAEVVTVDGLQHVLMTHCAKTEDFLTDHTTMVNSVFRIFISNGNSPLTIEELSSITGKPANTILRTLAGTQVYKGIRPAH